jgi:hypothetical protein
MRKEVCSRIGSFSAAPARAAAQQFGFQAWKNVHGGLQTGTITQNMLFQYYIKLFAQLE